MKTTDKTWSAVKEINREQLFNHAMQRAKNNPVAAAVIMGVAPSTVYRWMKQKKSKR